MNCKEARALLSAYLDDELEAAARRRLMVHLECCPSCREEEQELARTVSLLRYFARSNGHGED